MKKTKHDDRIGCETEMTVAASGDAVGVCAGECGRVVLSRLPAKIQKGDISVATLTPNEARLVANDLLKAANAAERHATGKYDGRKSEGSCDE